MTFSVLCIYNLGEMAAETGSGQALPSDRPPLLCHGTYRASGLYIRHNPRRHPKMLMLCQLQATVHIHHATLSPFLSHSDCPPWTSIPSFPRVPPVSSRPNLSQRLAHTALLNRPGVDDADDDVDYWVGACPTRGLRAVHAKLPRTTSLPLSRLTQSCRRQRESCGVFIRLKL
jgi:hypothetical protein